MNRLLQILHAAGQPSYRGMFNGLLRSDDQELKYNKTKFPSTLNMERKFVSKMVFRVCMINFVV